METGGVAIEASGWHATTRGLRECGPSNESRSSSPVVPVVCSAYGGEYVATACVPSRDGRCMEPAEWPPRPWGTGVPPAATRFGPPGWLGRAAATALGDALRQWPGPREYVASHTDDWSVCQESKAVPGSRQVTGLTAANATSVDIRSAVGCTPVAAQSSIRCDCGDSASLVRTGMLDRWSWHFRGESTYDNDIPCRQFNGQRPVLVGLV